jgi:UDP:flavonoid glycosyltransferase YjiC (YdhE family)
MHVRESLALALLLAAVAAASPGPSLRFGDPIPTWAGDDPAALDAPSPEAPSAAVGLKYLLLPLPIGPSHSFVLTKIGHTLAERGGDVLAVVGPLNEKHVVPPPYGSWATVRVAGAGAMPKLMQRLEKETWRQHWTLLSLGPLLWSVSEECDSIVADTAFMARARSFAPDLIVGDAMDPCAGVLSELLGVARAEIHVGSAVVDQVASPWAGTGRNWRIPRSPLTTPAHRFPVPPPLGLAAALGSALMDGVNAAVDYATMRPPVAALHKRHGVDLTTPAARGRNSLLLINADPSWEHTRALPPGVQYIGGVTAGPGAPLPADLDAWLKGARGRGQRVLYQAMGSIFRSRPGEAVPLLAGLAALPAVAVLAKLAPGEATDAELAALPPNVRVVGWAPQNDLLASGHVSLFVTHGGANSIGEAVFHGVPVVVAPAGAEQPDNAVKVAAAGFGVGIVTHRPAPSAVVAAAGRVLADLEGYAAAAKTAQARARAGRPPAAAAAAAAIERVALLGPAARLPLAGELSGLTAARVVAGGVLVLLALRALLSRALCAPAAGRARVAATHATKKRA